MCFQKYALLLALNSDQLYLPFYTSGSVSSSPSRHRRRVNVTMPMSPVDMDSSQLSQQVHAIISQLRDLFDEIGVPSHEQEAREAEVGSLHHYGSGAG